MRTYGWSLLVVVIVIVGLLAVPATREVIRVEGSAFCPFAPLHGFYLSKHFMPGLPAGFDPDPLVAQARAKHPKDWKIAMGAGLLTEDEQKKLDYLEEAVELAPDEPAALFVLAGGRIERLMWYRFEEYYRSQEELSPDSEEELLATEMAELVREALNRLKQIDPDNAAPEALLAWLEFDEMRDTEALAHLRAAAGKTKWDLYGGALLQGYLQGSTRLEIPEFEAVGCENLWIALKSRFRELRELARVAEFIGQEAKEAGRHQEAVEDWMAVIRLGRLIRHDGDRESEDLTGVSLEKIGAAPIYEWMAMDAAKQQGLTPVWEVAWKERDYRDDVMIPGGIFEGEHLDYFIEHAGAAAAADILDSLKQGEELRVEKSKYGVKPYNARFVDVLWAVLTQSLGIIMFGHMVFLLVLTILLWIVVRDRAQSVTRLRRFWVIILALIPLALILALWVGYSVRPVVMLFQDSIQMLVCRPSLGIVESNPGIIFASLPIMLLLGSLFAGVWIKRKSGGRHSWRAIFAGVLRQVVPLCLVLLTLCYALNTVQAALLRTAYVSMVKRSMEGEMAEFRRDHPQFFTAPSPVEPQ